MRQWIRLATLAAMAAGLAACQSGYGPGYGGDPNSIEGLWLDPNGIQSSFSAGRFETRTTDTNTLLATGKYTYINPRLVQVDIRSLVRNTNARVNCSLVSPTRLNCTSNEGGQFSLQRRLG
ncbi:hypothetical protein [Hoeflea poritis]|uniref:Outer membrane lipoprotein n=1 Tax=Hoeflea poritis TaxID=2993659 RepID=A0ABT4VSR6_9HYPH|nr:hypothetical protein [Hoeflea poritis]MDA4847117.1 hypothetical protein [Hoeflea poritis]